MMLTEQRARDRAVGRSVSDRWGRCFSQGRTRRRARVLPNSDECSAADRLKVCGPATKRYSAAVRWRRVSMPHRVARVRHGIAACAFPAVRLMCGGREPRYGCRAAPICPQESNLSDRATSHCAPSARRARETVDSGTTEETKGSIWKKDLCNWGRGFRRLRERSESNHLPLPPLKLR